MGCRVLEDGSLHQTVAAPRPSVGESAEKLLAGRRRFWTPAASRRRSSSFKPPLLAADCGQQCGTEEGSSNNQPGTLRITFLLPSAEAQIHPPPPPHLPPPQPPPLSSWRFPLRISHPLLPLPLLLPLLPFLLHIPLPSLLCSPAPLLPETLFTTPPLLLGDPGEARAWERPLPREGGS